MGASEVPSLAYACCEVRHEGFYCEDPKEYIHLEEDYLVTVEFHDMHKLLRCKDLDVTQVTLFAI